MAKQRIPTTRPTQTKPENGPEAQAPATASAQPALGNEGPQTEAAGDIQALAAEAAPSAEQTAPVHRGPPGKTVVVIGPARGRWRIGRHFGQEPVAIAADEISETQFDLLMDDPELAVSIVDAPY